VRHQPHCQVEEAVVVALLVAAFIALQRRLLQIVLCTTQYHRPAHWHPDYVHPVAFCVMLHPIII
jgi:hypothetical protein